MGPEVVGSAVGEILLPEYCGTDLEGKSENAKRMTFLSIMGGPKHPGRNDLHKTCKTGSAHEHK